jgi:uncharacterized membrane protein YbhN (UPF0104 family)
MQHAIAFVPDRLLRNTDNWFVGRLAAVIEGMRESGGVGKRILATAAGLIIWGLLIGSAVLTQIAFGTPLDIETAFLAAVFAAAFSIIPINAPLAVGTGEIIWTAAMVIVGLPLETAIPLAISVRVSTVSVMIIEGALGGGLLLSMSAASRAAAAETTEIGNDRVRNATCE